MDVVSMPILQGWYGPLPGDFCPTANDTLRDAYVEWKKAGVDLSQVVNQISRFVGTEPTDPLQSIIYFKAERGKVAVVLPHSRQILPTYFTQGIVEHAEVEYVVWALDRVFRGISLLKIRKWP